MKRFLLIAATLILSVIVLTGCSRGRVDVGYGDPDTRIEGGDGKGGPPPWAPAHGYRRKMAYRYYPNHEAYYNVEKGGYVWLEAGKWRVGATLPASWRIATEPFVNIELIDEPQKSHKQIQKLYPKQKQGKPEGKPGQGKPGKGKSGK